MLLGGAPAAPADQTARQAQYTAPQPETAPVFEGQPPVVAPPEPQPDPAQAQQQPDTGKQKPLTEPKVGGFRPLGIDLPPANEPPSDEKKPRFVWKKLDD
jgi:hypothetical protein